MNLNVRYCRKCKRAYDIGINFDICPECRGIKLKEVEESGNLLEL